MIYWVLTVYTAVCSCYDLDLHTSHEKFPHLQVRKLGPRKTKWLNHSPGGTFRHNSGFKARTLSLMLQGPQAPWLSSVFVFPPVTSNAWLLRWTGREDPLKFIDHLMVGGKEMRESNLAWVIQSKSLPLNMIVSFSLWPITVMPH